MDQNSRPLKRRRIDPKLTNTKKPKKPRLPRPKTTLTFTLPKHLVPDLQQSATSTAPSTPLLKAKDVRSRSSTPTIAISSPSSEPPLIRLNRIAVLLSAIHRRNKNQHRNQRWYRHLSTLYRSVTKLIRLYERSDKPFNSTAIPRTKENPLPGIESAADIRRRLEEEARLRSQREVLEDHLRETLVPSAYVGFSSVVADSQFANLGLVLLGVLSDVVSVVGLVRNVEKKVVREVADSKDVGITGDEVAGRSGHAKRGGRLVGLSTLITGPDQGVVVERIYDSDGGMEAGQKGMKSSDDSPREREDKGRDDMGEVVAREDIEDIRTSEGRTTKSEKNKLPSPEVLSEGTITKQDQDNLETFNTMETEATVISPHAKGQEQKHNIHIQRHQDTPLQSHLERISTKSPTSSTHANNPSNSSEPNITFKPSSQPPTQSLPRKANTTNHNRKEPHQSKAPAQDTGSKKAKKKKGTKKNAIDDLFSGFG